MMRKVILNISIFLIGMQPLHSFASNLKPLAEIFVWHASQEAASTWATVATSGGVHKTKVKAPNVQFKWDLGFKAGLLYEAENKNWDTSFIYTYYQAKTTSSISNALQLIFPEFFSGFTSLNFFFGGNLNWRLQMNMFDYDFGRKIKIGKDLTLRPAIGLKGGTIFQKINTTWDAVVYQSTEQVKNNFTGFGPSLRLDSDWHLFKHLSLFGNFATALMWGHWDVADVYNRPFVSGVVTATTITTYLNAKELGMMMFDYVLGLEVNSHTKPGFRVQLGYEMQLWINQLRMPTFQILPVHGDLTLQGATCRIILDL